MADGQHTQDGTQRRRSDIRPRSRRSPCSPALAMPQSIPASDNAAPTFAKPLRLLVLGGTRYLGPAFVKAAIQRGHEVTLFSRGRTQPWLFGGLEKLTGNRYPETGTGLSALRGRSWDVAIDLCGQYPRVVEASAALLANQVDHYVMVSSISAYASFKTPGVDENAPLRPLTREYVENPDLVEGDWPTYGARKALGEAAVARYFPGRHTIARPGPIVGGDNNDGGGAYWAERLYRDARILVPGDGSDAVQLIDVADVAAFLVRSAERRLEGAYNLVGPERPLNVRGLLDACRRAVGGKGEIVYAGNLPEGMGGMPLIAPYHLVPGHATMRIDRALAAGLTLRPLEETILENWVDHRSRRGNKFDFAAAGMGISPAKEAEFIKL
jgi:2'-hydroxyisoflavone reductase